MNIANIIGLIIMIVLGFVALYALLNIIKFFIQFHLRHCKYCNHIMEFKGYHEGDGEAYFNFHCEHCGAWERVDRKEMLNENETSVA